MRPLPQRRRGYKLVSRVIHYRSDSWSPSNPSCIGNISQGGSLTCHGWSGLAAGATMGYLSQYQCNFTVPKISVVIPASLYMWCDCETDSRVTGTAKHNIFGQMLSQLAIGNWQVYGCMRRTWIRPPTFENLGDTDTSTILVRKLHSWRPN